MGELKNKTSAADHGGARAEHFLSPTPHIRGTSAFQWTDPGPICFTNPFHRRLSSTVRTDSMHGPSPGLYLLSYIGFYSAPQCWHCKRCTSYSNSVRLSIPVCVCLSHAGIVSKCLHVARCSLHCQITKCV